MPKIESEKIDCLLRLCSRPAPQGKIKSVRTHSEVIEQFDSFSMLKLLFLVRNWHYWSRKPFTRQMTPQIREETAKTAVFRQRWQAWKVVRSIAAVRQCPRTPRNWRCSFAFFESFLWHFNKKQHAEVIFRLSRPVLCKNQENGSGKQWSLHAPLNTKICSCTVVHHRTCAFLVQVHQCSVCVSLVGFRKTRSCFLARWTPYFSSCMPWYVCLCVERVLVSDSNAICSRNSKLGKRLVPPPPPRISLRFVSSYSCLQKCTSCLYLCFLSSCHWYLSVCLSICPSPKWFSIATPPPPPLSLSPSCCQGLYISGILGDRWAGEYYRKRGSASYIVRQWLLWESERERERERERDACDVIDITLKSRVIMHMITSTARS